MTYFVAVKLAAAVAAAVDGIAFDSQSYPRANRSLEVVHCKTNDKETCLTYSQYCESGECQSHLLVRWWPCVFGGLCGTFWLLIGCWDIICACGTAATVPVELICCCCIMAASSLVIVRYPISSSYPTLPFCGCGGAMLACITRPLNTCAGKKKHWIQLRMFQKTMASLWKLHTSSACIMARANASASCWLEKFNPYTNFESRHWWNVAVAWLYFNPFNIEQFITTSWSCSFLPTTRNVLFCWWW